MQVTSNQITVLLFSQLKELLGQSVLEVTVSGDGLTGRHLLEKLVQDYPPLAPFRSVMRLAVNQKYETDDVFIVRGDEVAIVTPVSGG